MLVAGLLLHLPSEQLLQCRLHALILVNHLTRCSVLRVDASRPVLIYDARHCDALLADDVLADGLAQLFIKLVALGIADEVLLDFVDDAVVVVALQVLLADLL